jgi:hypothetical protein
MSQSALQGKLQEAERSDLFLTKRIKQAGQTML